MFTMDADNRSQFIVIAVEIFGFRIGIQCSFDEDRMQQQ
jgi:predicted transporter